MGRSQKIRVSKSDGGKLIEQLRAIYLTLLAVSLITTIAITTQGDSRLVTAHDDIQRTIGLLPFLQNRLWLEDYAGQLIDARPNKATLPHRFWRFDMPAKGPFDASPSGRLPGKYRVDLEGPHWSIARKGDKTGYRRDGDYRPALGLEAPKTLGDWKNLWNVLRDRRACIPVWISDTAYAVVTRNAPQLKSEFLPIQLQPTPDFNKSEIRTNIADADYFLLLALQPIGDGQAPPYIVWEKGQDYAYLAYLYNMSTAKDPDNPVDAQGVPFPPKILIPVNCGFVDIFAQQYIANLANSKWAPGSFSQSFESLESTTKGLENVSLPDIATFLAAQIAQTKKDVEILGIKIPTELITRWGLVLVVSVQFYFWLNLRRLASKPEWLLGSEPWVGVYPDAWSQFAFRCSSTLLPALAVVLALAIGLTVEISTASVATVLAGGIEMAIALSGLALALSTWNICGKIAHSVSPRKASAE
jgi:hypothetical protein